jgi:hypothetical protein
MAIEIFDIEWTKPKPFEDALTQSASHEGGIYAIYNLTGSTARIIYIGTTKDFYSRSSTHRNAFSHFNSDNKKCLISFGVVSCFGISRITDKVTTEQLHDLESFLINFEKPDGNSESTKKGYKGNAIIVVNNGTKGSFDKIISSNTDIINYIRENIR